MNRRTFMGTSLVAVGSGTMLLEGCTFGGVIAEIKAYIPIGIAAFNGVVTLLTGLGIIPPGTSTLLALLIAAVKGGFADIIAAIDAYNNAPAADKTTLLQKISLILSEISANIGKFFADLNISNSSVLTLVTGLVQLILSTLAGFASQLPAPPTPVALSARVAGHPIVITPKILSRSEFKAQWNKTVTTAGHPELVLT